MRRRLSKDTRRVCEMTETWFEALRLKRSNGTVEALDLIVCEWAT
jgi:hypothetical protein